MLISKTQAPWRAALSTHGGVCFSGPPKMVVFLSVFPQKFGCFCGGDVSFSGTLICSFDCVGVFVQSEFGTRFPQSEATQATKPSWGQAQGLCEGGLPRPGPQCCPCFRFLSERDTL